MIKAVLLKPLDGLPEGTEREFENADFDALKALGAVRAVRPEASAVKAAPAVLNKKARVPANKSDKA